MFCYDRRMELEFPYQIVSFLGEEPATNEAVYSGVHGWYPQITIKRRFKLHEITEERFIEELKNFFTATSPQTISTGELVKPERMPVRVIPLTNQSEMKSLHDELLAKFSEKITSRYPEREGERYYPHITAEYDGRFVIPVGDYTNKTLKVNNVWLLKDVSDENSLAYAKIR